MSVSATCICFLISISGNQSLSILMSYISCNVATVFMYHGKYITLLVLKQNVVVQKHSWLRV